jgi:hypothetical protein
MSTDFRSLLQSRWSDEEWSNIKHHRAFNALPCGSFFLSIQASPLHYCYPRAMLPVDEYEAWEVFIWGSDDEPVSPWGRDDVARWREYIEPAGRVLGYVPTTEVQALYDHLCTMEEA